MLHQDQKAKTLKNSLVSSFYLGREQIVSLTSSIVPSFYFNIDFYFHIFEKQNPISTMNRLLPIIFLISFFATSSFAGDIKITSPTGEMDSYISSVLPIRWEPGTSTKFVKIEYAIHHFGIKFRLLETSVPNTGQYDWDLRDYLPRVATISIKISDTTNPRNYSVSDKISLKDCVVNADFEKPSRLCTDSKNVFKNLSTNATNFEWMVNDKTISTDKDLELPISNFEPFKLTLKASSNKCYNEYYIDVYTPSTELSGPCGEPVIQEMVIVDHNEVMRNISIDYYSIKIPQKAKILAFQLTHELPNYTEDFLWDWTDIAITGFTNESIDYTSGNENGKFSVNWTSPDPNGSSHDGSLYTLEVTTENRIEPETLDIPATPKVRLGKRDRKTELQAETVSSNPANVSYARIEVASKLNPSSKLKTTGVILTTEGVIILQ